MILEFLLWIFLGFNCLFTGSNEPVDMILGIFERLITGNKKGITYCYP